MDLRLRRTEILTGTPVLDDWCVTLDGYTIGRIKREVLGGGRAVWAWYFHIVPNSGNDRGDAESLDEAKAAFRRHVEAVGPFDPRRMRRLPLRASDGSG